MSPLTEARLAEIEARVEKVRQYPARTFTPRYIATNDVPDLLAEVRRLRAELLEVVKSAEMECDGMCEGWKPYGRHDPNCPWAYAADAREALGLEPRE